jgi:ribonuclease HI
MGLFNGSSQGDPPKGGEGVILYFSHNHFLSFKDGTGRPTNNHNKLTSLKLVLILYIEKGITQIQVLGDSLLVIRWIKRNLH